jgi:hypothetical protein
MFTGDPYNYGTTYRVSGGFLWMLLFIMNLEIGAS